MEKNEIWCTIMAYCFTDKLHLPMYGANLLIICSCAYIKVYRFVVEMRVIYIMF